jgi:(S)-2-hydroxyglutarate dehydrogenase
MLRFDCVVIGGGIVGLAVAKAILETRPAARLAVLEKEDGWARHQSGRNSGVLHSGIYYQPGSLKAKLCREGNRQLVAFCKNYDIRHEVCGKLIVATDQSEIPRMEHLYQRGIANGLVVKKMSAGEIREIEPHVRCLGGIQVPSTGIVDFTAVCQKLAELVKKAGGEPMLKTEVVRIRTNASGSILETSQGEIEAIRLINCAGLHSDRMARLAGADPGARIVPFRGEYYELKPERRFFVRNLIYPVPDPTFPFLGVHFTRMIDGSIHAGPNAVLSLKREGYHRMSFDLRDSMETLSYSGFWRLAARHGRAGLEEIQRSFSKAAFTESLRRLIPEIGQDDLLPAAPGVRAQALRPDGSMVDDFLVSKVASAIHVCNAPSPAATASLEIGRAIAKLVYSDSSSLN